MAALEAHDWPGNIRELRNVLRIALAFAETRNHIELKHLSPSLGITKSCDVAYREKKPPLKQDEERIRIECELARHHWQIGLTATALGMSRTTLYRKLRRFGLLPSRRRP